MSIHLYPSHSLTQNPIRKAGTAEGDQSLTKDGQVISAKPQVGYALLAAKAMGLTTFLPDLLQYSQMDIIL